MVKSPEITPVGFRPPGDERLAVEVMFIAELQKRAPAGHFASLQRADFYRLIGISSGHTCPMVDFSDYPAQTMDWLLIRPGQVMRNDFSKPWTGWLLVFRPDGLYGSSTGNIAGMPNLQRHVEDLVCLHSLQADQHQWMTHSLNQMLADSAPGADAALRNDMLLLQLASTLLRLTLWQVPQSSLLPSKNSALVQFKRFGHRLELDFSRQHQVQHYARALGMSDKSLGRVCMAAAGLPAKACIAQCITLEARRLLAHTTLTVQAIAYELGFEEATNFGKFFRRQTGVTPLAFRIAHSPSAA